MSLQLHKPIIRRAGVADLSAIISIWLEGISISYGFPAPPVEAVEAFFLNRLQNPDPSSGIWLAEVNGDTVAWQSVQPCYLNLLSKWAESSTYVSRNFKGRIAIQLLEVAIAHATTHKVEYLTAIVRKDNRAVLRLAKTLDWPIIGTFPRLPTDESPELLFLAKPLSPSIQPTSGEQ